MSQIILNPIAAGSETNLSTEPAGSPNWEVVSSVVGGSVESSYVYVVGNTFRDMYDMTGVAGLVSGRISQVEVVGVCRKDPGVTVGSVAPAIKPPGAAVDMVDLGLPTDNFLEYSNVWELNPDTLNEWTLTELNGIEAGFRLVEFHGVDQVLCSHVFVRAEIELAGERISNSSIYQPSDVIHVNQNYSVIAVEEMGRILTDATTVQIRYIDPDGVTGNLTGVVIDESGIVAAVSTALNNKPGKWRFKLYAVLPDGSILEGVTFFTNVVPEWV